MGCPPGGTVPLHKGEGRSRASGCSLCRISSGVKQEFKLLDFQDCPQSIPQPITLTMSPRTSYMFHLKPLKFTFQDDTSLPCPSETGSLPGGSFRLFSPSGQLTSQLPDLSSHHPLLLLTSHTITTANHWKHTTQHVLSLPKTQPLFSGYSPPHPSFTPSRGHRPPELPAGSHPACHCG